ncbi:MAG: hypothetical protein IPL61_12115 [Myxococcales bacterium]|nr:hypothetical protein [Myxococcales bacterium]
MLALEPYAEPSTFDDQQRSKRGEAPRKFVGLPEAVRVIQGRPVPVLHGKYPRARFDEFKPQVEPAAPDDTRLTMTVELMPARAVATVRGRLGRMQVDNLGIPEPGLHHDEAWSALLTAAGLRDRWDAGAEVLRVSFDETTDRERASFQRDLTIKKPSIGAWGTFDDTVLERVPLAARTPADAAAWARWRLMQSVRDTATTARYAEWAKDAVTPFGSLAPVLPTRAALAAELRGRGKPEPIYWRLQAAEDWNL